MSQLSVETEDTFATLLELAANNDIKGFKTAIESDPSAVDEVGLWYGRQNGSKRMVHEHQTPLMVAAMYGSIDVLKLIISRSKADVNRLCGVDTTTALHCAASGGSANAVEVIKLLLSAGADPNLIDVNGHRPVDLIVVSPKFPGMKKTLEELLGVVEGEITILPLSEPEPEPEHEHELEPELDLDSVFNVPKKTLEELVGVVEGEIPILPLREREPEEHEPDLDLVFNDPKREYPIDPSFPDIKNSIYSTDEFRMYLFKVRTCSRAYSHDWTDCPFVHPGENARRRDPRKYHYSSVPCPDYRKGACRGGDMCEYAHGVFESWLHPAQYRTRLCKDGPGCNRRVCFFAHTKDEIRPLFVSSGPMVQSPRSTSGPSALDFVASMSLMPGMGLGAGPGPSYTPPQSPNVNGNWAQPNLPSLHLPGSNLQSSRLRSSLSARDMDKDLNIQLLNELNRQQRTILTPTKLDDIFAAESLSPRFSDQPVFSPRHNSSGFNPFQHQQSMLSPINTNFSPKNTGFSAHSPGRMSPRNVDPISPMSSRVSMLARENQQQFRRSSSGGVMGSRVDPWSQWGSGLEKADWGIKVKPNADIDTDIDSDEFGKLRRSSSFENGGNNGEEPDLSWVRSLVKETGPVRVVARGGSGGSGEGGSSGQMDQSALSAWIEQMQLDHFVAQQN